jgi:ligand-binding SRPBCC domain-containing protein
MHGGYRLRCGDTAGALAADAGPGDPEPMGEIRVSSVLAAPPDVVWRHASSPDGVNRELAPLLRMSFPDDVDSLVGAGRPGERLFRSWIWLLGVLPVEYDDLTFEAVEPGRRFLERSTLLTQRVWEHERTIEPADGGCRVTDRVRFEPRVHALGPLHGAIFRAVFRWRHRNLRRHFGA